MHHARVIARLAHLLEGFFHEMETKREIQDGVDAGDVAYLCYLGFRVERPPVLVTPALDVN